MVKIIVVDDDPGVRSTVTRILEREGHIVMSAEDGEMGMRLARTERPDLVVTDLIMPDKDGIEIIQELRAERPDLKILAMSGGGRVGPTGPLADAEFFGADASLAKPFTTEDLTAAVNALLGEGGGG
jgi:DNA-binding response OmpR family regulator